MRGARPPLGRLSVRPICHLGPLFAILAHFSLPSFFHMARKGSNNISSVDHRTIGLSPQYWAHTPLLIGDLVSLPLINGVDCFVSQTASSREIDADRGAQTIVPLSKVLLQGILTAIDRRPNGCILLVLDDGTGSIDVRYWDNSHQSGAFDFMELQKPADAFAVGDYCEVLGKIKAMTAGTKYFCTWVDSSVDAPDVRLGCVREVHASSVCVMNQRMNGEVVHWFKCLKFSQDVHQQKVKSGTDLLPLLGDSIVSSILSADYTVESESSNILERNCCQTPQRFKRALLYCHCEGTIEKLDPMFRYRDALLNKLLATETKLQTSSQSEYHSYTEDCIDLLGCKSDCFASPPLLFSFESIYKDEELSSLAKDIVSSTLVPEANARQLVQNTFRAMSNDGLISLFDTDADLYLLLSVDRVMEPYLCGSLSGAMPFFVRNISKKRMNRLRRCLSDLALK